jgi:hypothetical protein
VLGVPAGQRVGVTGAKEHAADAGDSFHELLRRLGAGLGGCRRRTLLCWVNAWVGLEEPVELAGDVADPPASDLAVGLALVRAAPKQVR